MTTRTQITQRVSLAALVAAASIPAMIACGGSAATTPGATAPSASVAGAYPQYPQQGAYPQQPPAGYPQQQPPAGYPQQPAPAGYPQQPTQPGYAQTTPPGATPATPPGATPAQGTTPAPLGTVLPTDPSALASLFQQAVAAIPASLSNPGAIAGDPVELGLKASAARYAAGEQPEGQIAKGTLQEGGQHLSFSYTLDAGKCYTILGYSPAGQVKDLDLYLLAPPFYNPAIPGGVAGQDTTHDNTPTVGAAPHPMCPVIPGLSYKVDISSRSGSGNVGVQVYSKPK
jgi:hypothetical protein